MAAHTTTRPAPFGAATTYRMFSAVATIGSKFTAWNDVRVTRKALQQLSDHELDDIGLCRGDIEDIARARA